MGFAYQSVRPATLTLTCDVDRSDILDVARDASAEFGLRVLVVSRAHTGKARCSQVRNNAIRAIIASAAAEPEDRLIFLDGDTVPSFSMVERHAELGNRRLLVSTYRVNLTEEQTLAFDESKVRAGEPPVELTAHQLAGLDQRQSRYVRQAFMRSIKLGKAHKPRLIGGHFSVPLAGYLAVNGCDEVYEGYGQEDDDLSRRLYQAGYESVVAVDAIHVYHLFHPSRAPTDWHHAPGVLRFRQPAATRCERGLENPIDQPTVQCRWIESGRLLEPTVVPHPSSSPARVVR